MRLGWMLLVGIVVVGCGRGAEKDTTGSPPRPRGPGRARETACAAERPPGNSAGITYGTCKTDDECKDGSNGRCMTVGARVRENKCTYDACFHDADCKTGGPCECQTTGNVCLSGNCRVDADCGPNGSCGRSNAMSCGGGESSYYCRKPEDTCTDECGDHKQCVYLEELGHWGCAEYPKCPVG